MSNSTTGNSTPSSRVTPTLTKIYVDGFHVDDVEIPKLCDHVEEVALTPKVKELLGEEDKVIADMYPVPLDNPRFIMITTEM